MAGIEGGRLAGGGPTGRYAALLPALAACEAKSRLPYTVTVLFFAVEAVQLLGFVLAPSFHFNLVVLKQLVYGIFAFHAPLFDRRYGPFSYIYYTIPFFLGAAAVVVTAAAFLALVARPSLSKSAAFRVLANSAHLIGGPLCVPLLHLFIGAMDCNGGQLLNFPEQQCWDPLHITMLVFGCVAALGTAMLALTIALSLGDPDLYSRRFAARPHSYCEVALATIKVTLVVLMHVMLPRSAQGYPVVVAALAAAAFVLHVALLPFYTQTITAFRCSLLAVVTYTAIINIITALSAPTMVHANVNSFVVAALAPVIALLGGIAASLRVNEELLHKISRVSEEALMPLHVARLPFSCSLRLNEAAGVPACLRALEADLVEEDGLTVVDSIDVTAPYSPLGDHSRRPHVARPVAWELAVAARCECLLPFITSVTWHTDAEVATRYLVLYHNATGRTIPFTPSQLIFGLRIYFRAMVHHKDSGYILVHLANYLAEYLNAYSVAFDLLTQVDRGAHGDESLTVLYLSHILNRKSKHEAGVNERTISVAFQRARILHLKVLSANLEFWEKLRVETNAVLPLVVLANTLDDLRNRTLRMYAKAVEMEEGNAATLNSLASFVEHVYGNEFFGDRVRLLAERIDEFVRSRSTVVAGEWNSVRVESLRWAQWRPRQRQLIDRRLKAGLPPQDKTIRVLLFATIVMGAAMFAFSIIKRGAVLMVFDEVASVHTALADIERGTLLVIKLATFWTTRNCLEEAVRCVKSPIVAGYLGDLFSAIINIQNVYVSMRSRIAKDGLQADSMHLLRHRVVPLLTFRMQLHPDFGIFGSSNQSQTLYATYIDSITTATHSTLPLGLATCHTAAMLSNIINMGTKDSLFQWYVYNIIEGHLRPPSVYLHKYADTTAEGISVFIKQINNFITTVFFIGIATMIIIMALLASDMFSYGSRKINLVNMFKLIPSAFIDQLCVSAQASIESFKGLLDGADEAATPSGSVATPASAGAARTYDPVTPSKPLAHHSSAAMEVSPSILHRRSSSRYRSIRTLKALANETPQGSCLKKPERGGKRFSQRRANQKRVRFQPDVKSSRSRCMKEPKLRLEAAKEDIIADFESSMRDASQKGGEDHAQQERMRESQSAEKLIDMNHHTQKLELRLFALGAKLGDRGPGWLFQCFGVPSLVVLGCALTALSIAVLVLYRRVGVAISDKVVLRDVVMSELDNFERYDYAVSVFTSFGSASSYAVLARYAVVQQGFRNITHVTANYSASAALLDPVLALTLTSALAHCVSTGLVASALSARALDAAGMAPLVAAPLLATFRYAGQGVTELTRYSNVLRLSSEYVRPSLDSLPDSTTPVGLRALALHQHRSQRSAIDLATARAIHAKIVDSLVTAGHAATNERLGAFHRVVVTTLVLACVYAVAVVALSVCAVVRTGRTVVLGLLLVSACCALVAVGLAAADFSRASNAPYTIRGALPFLETCEELRAAAYANVGRLEEYVLRGTSAALASLLESSPASPTWAAIVARMSQQAAAHGVPAAVLRACLAELSATWQIQQVAMYLAYASFAKLGGLSPTPPAPPFLATYEYSLESSYATDVILYAADNPGLQYANPAVDLARPAAELADMARFALFGMRGDAHFQAALNAIDSVRSTAVTATNSRYASTERLTEAISIALIIVSGCATLSALAAAMVPAVNQLVAKLFQAHWPRRYDILKIYGKTFLSFGVVGGAVLTVFVAQFIVVTVMQFHGAAAAVVISAAYEREAALARSLSLSMYINRSLGADDIAMASSKQGPLLEACQVLSRTREQLLLSGPGDNGAGSAMYLSEQQKAIMYSAGADGGPSLDQQYLTWVKVASSIARLIIPFERGAAHPSNSLKDAYVIPSATKELVRSSVATLVALHDPIAAGLRRSSKQFATDAGAASDPLIPGTVLFVLFVLLSAGVVVGYIPRAVRRLNDDVDNTRPLLQMVPPAARDAVPSITLLLESGILESDALDSGLVLDEGVKQFIASWQHTDPQASGLGSCKLLDACEAPVMLMTVEGEVVFASKLLLEALGYHSTNDNAARMMMSPADGLKLSTSIAEMMLGVPSGMPVKRNVSLLDVSGKRWLLSGMFVPLADGVGTKYLLCVEFRLFQGQDGGDAADDGSVTAENQVS